MTIPKHMEMLEKVILSEFDFVMLIDLNKNHFTFLRGAEKNTALAPFLGLPYDQVVEALCNQFTVTSHRELVRQHFCLSTIKTKLVHNTIYEFVGYSFFPAAPSALKKHRMYYFEKESGLVLYTCSDTAAEQDEKAQTLEKIKQRSEQMKKIKSRLACAMWKNLRTPLECILRSAQQILKDRGASQQICDCAAEIYQEAREMQETIQQILLSDHSDPTCPRLRCNTIDLHSVIETFRQQCEELLAQRRQTLIFDCEPLDSLHLLGSECYLQSSVMELVKNASIFSDEGQAIHVHLREIRSSSPRAHFQVTIRDNGVGISGDMLPFIFEPFYQVKQTPMQPAQGPGLGLFTVKRLLSLKGGKIDVQSTVGVGTTVTIDWFAPKDPDY